MGFPFYISFYVNENPVRKILLRICNKVWVYEKTFIGRSFCLRTDLGSRNEYRESFGEREDV